jgi:hypothetical protein
VMRSLTSEAQTWWIMTTITGSWRRGRERFSVSNVALNFYIREAQKKRRRGNYVLPMLM